MELPLRLIGYIVSICFWLFLKYDNKRKAFEFYGLHPARSAKVKLYWQGPLASIEANKWLYWLCMIPIGFFTLMTVVSFWFEKDPGLNWHPIGMILIMFGYCNLIRGPNLLVVAPQGIFWISHHSWDKILQHRWMSRKNGEFLCFTLDRDDNQLKLETQLGPLTTDDRTKIEVVLERRAIEHTN